MFPLDPIPGYDTIWCAAPDDDYTEDVDYEDIEADTPEDILD